MQGYPDLLLIKLESQPVLNLMEIFEWRGFHHYYSTQYKKKAIISYEPKLNMKKEGVQNIFEAANQVTKALNYHLERMRRVDVLSVKEAKGIGELYDQPLVMCYPVIVFDGLMFELTYYKGIAKLVPTQYVQYLFSHKFPLLGDKFIIDIVHIDFLEQYLKMINDEFARLNKRIESISPEKDKQQTDSK